MKNEDNLEDSSRQDGAQFQLILNEAEGSSPSSVDSSSDRKRRVHLKCEQQRREAIKGGYEMLKDLLPAELAPIGCKLTNASILYRTVEYLQKLEEDAKANESELKHLESQHLALQIINQNYEQMNSAVSSTTATGSNSDAADLKLKMFQTLVDHWFQSFQAEIQTHDYAMLTHSLIAWIEKHYSAEEIPQILASAIASTSSANRL